MTVSPGIREKVDIREELDVVSIEPQFLERQRNRYASRGVAYIVLLNGFAAIALLVGLAHGTMTGENVKPFADAMMVFGAGAAAGLTSAFFAYLGRTFRMERPGLAAWRRPIRWLAIAAAIAGTACFLGGLNMARIAVLPEDATIPPSAASPKADKTSPESPPQPKPSAETP
jgi:hypothetical protein